MRKAEADYRVERSLYERANGYSYDAGSASITVARPLAHCSSFIGWTI